MTEKFLLVILSGVVVRFISAAGVNKYIRISKSDKHMKTFIGFHIMICLYLIGSLLKYIGLALLFAGLIKQYILT